jgi:predicted SnoaL-like aldol condensation-catalyzing enzyme
MMAGLIAVLRRHRGAPHARTGAAHFLDAFEDFRVEADDVAVDGDTLVGRYTYRARHTQTFNEIEMHSIDIWRVSDGLLAEHWDELNTLELFQQIGAIPELP